MVKIVPFKSLHPTEEEEALLHPDNPNRFASREYDRSVFEKEFCKRSPDCPCMMCSKVPVVVLSPGKTICKELDISLRNVKEFVDGGVLQELQEKSFLVYGQQHGDHIQVAILAALSVEDCINGVIKKHENIIKEPELPSSPMRRRQKYKPTNVDPVMMMYKDNCIVNELISKIISENSPITTVSEGDGNESKVWAVTEEEDIVALSIAFEQVENLYIADGHHRTSAAIQFVEQQIRNKRKIPQHSRFLMAYLFPQSHLRVISYNRCVKSIAPHSEMSFMSEIGKRFSVRECCPFSQLECLDGHHDSLCTSQESTSVSSSFSVEAAAASWSSSESSCDIVAAKDLSSCGGEAHETDAASDDGSHYSSGSSEHDIQSAACAVAHAESWSDDMDHMCAVRTESYAVAPPRSPMKDASMPVAFSCKPPLFPETRSRSSSSSSSASPRVLDWGVSREDFDGKIQTRISRADSACPDPECAMEIMTGCSDDMLIENFVNDQVIDQEHMLMYMNGHWYELCRKQDLTATPSSARQVDDLGVQILTSNLLTPILSMTSPSTDKRMVYVSGGDGIETLISLVDNRVAVAAFCVHRISVDDVIRVADAGELLPPKATCFDPKPLAGLLVRLH